MGQLVRPPGGPPPLPPLLSSDGGDEGAKRPINRLGGGGGYPSGLGEGGGYPSAQAHEPGGSSNPRLSSSGDPLTTSSASFFFSGQHAHGAPSAHDAKGVGGSWLPAVMLLLLAMLDRKSVV